MKLVSFSDRRVGVLLDKEMLDIGAAAAVLGPLTEVASADLRSPFPDPRKGGVGYGRNPRIFLKSGDVIEVEIKKISTLGNVVA